MQREYEWPQAGPLTALLEDAADTTGSHQADSGTSAVLFGSYVGEEFHRSSHPVTEADPFQTPDTDPWLGRRSTRSLVHHTCAST